MRKSLLLIILFAPLFLNGQEVDLTVQTGHSASINTVIFSPDDKFLVSSGDDNKIVIWDFFTSKQYDVLLGHRNKVTGICFSSDSKILYSTSLDSVLKVWDVYSGQCLKSMKFNSKLGGLVITNQDESLYVIGKEVTVIDLKNDYKRTKLEFIADNFFTAISISQNNNIVALGGENEEFAYLFDVKENILIKKIFAAVRNFEFDKEKSSVFYSTSMGKLFEFDWVKREINSTTSNWMLNTINDIAITQNELYFANNVGEIQILDRQNKWFKSGLLNIKRSKITSLDLSSDKKYLACTGDSRSIIIWDLKTRKVVKVLKGLVNQINDISFSEDGAEIIIGYANGVIRKTNLISNQTVVNQVRSKSAVEKSISQYSVTNIESYQNGEVKFKMFYKLKSLVYENSFDKIVEYSVNWTIEDNLLSLEKTEEENKKMDQYIRDLKKGTFHDNTYFLNKELLSAQNDSLGVHVQVQGEYLIAKSLKNNQIIFKIEMGHSDIVTSVAINGRYNYAATASWDGMIRFWDLSSGDLLTVYGAFANGQFVYIHDDGYYYSSKNALDYIGFKLNRRIYSFEQFDLKYNRPDIVASTLPYLNDEYVAAYYGAYLKRLSKLGLEEKDIEISTNLPLLEMEKSLVKNENIDVLTLKINCVDEKYDLDKLHLKINGVPEFGRFGKELSGHQFSETFTLNLNPGTNYVQLHVTNKMGVSSFKKAFTVESNRTNDETDLYLVTIGVSNYDEEQYKLNYARKDAEDVLSFFEGNELYFNNIHSKSLLDEEVTVKNVKELQKFVNQAKENDIVILFAAGHGVLDANLDYYFASHDMDFMNPQTKGIPYELFEEIMDKTKSRKKVMFIDACHSGEIDKDEVVENFIAEEENGELIFRGSQRSVKNKYDINSFDLSRSLFADMRLNNGSTVVSSAGGAEFAIEGDSWNNGVFTFVLLKGLVENEADLNGDKIIMLSELQIYIQIQVNKITEGLQTPTSRVENLNNDFRIK